MLTKLKNVRIKEKYFTHIGVLNLVIFMQTFKAYISSISFSVVRICVYRMKKSGLAEWVFCSKLLMEYD